MLLAKGCVIPSLYIPETFMMSRNEILQAVRKLPDMLSSSRYLEWNIF